jgi:tRNA (mo5U34)-methyltransferase
MPIKESCVIQDEGVLERPAQSRWNPEEIRTKISSRPQWWHRIEVAPGIFTPGHKDTITELRERIGLPDRLDGMTVLDIGAAEGFYSFECEKRGATVTAVDQFSAEQSGFALARELLGSNVKHLHGSIYTLDVNVLGRFDLVLCLGVLYHLRYPLLALDNLYSICRNRIIVESQICDRWYLKTDGTPAAIEEFPSELTQTSMAQFYPDRELNDDPTNWWAPNQIGLVKMLESSGFESNVHFSDGVRLVLHGRKVYRRSDAALWAAREWRSVKYPFRRFD